MSELIWGETKRCKKEGEPGQVIHPSIHTINDIKASVNQITKIGEFQTTELDASWIIICAGMYRRGGEGKSEFITPTRQGRKQERARQDEVRDRTLIRNKKKKLLTISKFRDNALKDSCIVCISTIWIINKGFRACICQGLSAHSTHAHINKAKIQSVIRWNELDGMKRSMIPLLTLILPC